MAHLLELQALAMSLSLPTKLVQDAGHTQVSDTCLVYANFLHVFDKKKGKCMEDAFCVMQFCETILIFGLCLCVQVEPGSCTVLAIIGEEEMVNNVTGSLKLL